MMIDVVIIGAGTGGLAAFKEARKFTNSIKLIDHGPLGTTCARVGCMPSKVFIQVAEDFYHRHLFAARGIHGAKQLTINRKEVFNYVRSLRDEWVNGVIQSMNSFKDHMINGTATFVEPYTVKVNGKTIKAKNIILATGSSSIIPQPWLSAFKEHLSLAA